MALRSSLECDTLIESLRVGCKWGCIVMNKIINTFLSPDSVLLCPVALKWRAGKQGI